MTRGKRFDVASVALTAFSCIVLGILIAPILIIFAVSFNPTEMLSFPPTSLSLRWYEAYLNDPIWMKATRISVVVAFFTAILSLIIGFAISVALVRYRFFGKTALRILVMSPPILPKIIIAVGLYFLYVRLRILGTTGALVAAHSIIAIPYVVMILTASLYSFDRRLEWAARSLGSPPLKALWLVTIPNLKPAIFGGGLLKPHQC